jgi:putative transposase
LPRRNRINTAGYYHIINRGVEKRKVFLETQDKDKFLEILCKEFEISDAILHSYVLMDNHYHLLIQTNNDNLSHLMREINSKYAMYFNKKYERVGHLWQGRFKSWYISNESYLWVLFRYIELNPIRAKIVGRFGKYYRSFIYDVLNKKVLECSKKSMFLKDNILEFLDIELNDNELEVLKIIKKQSINKILKVENQKDISEFLKKEYSNKKERNEAIIQAYKQGFKKSEIAKFLNVSLSLISKITKEKEGQSLKSSSKK